MYIVVKYENVINLEQPFEIMFKTYDLEEAKNYAYNQAVQIYGSEYVDDFKEIKLDYIKKHSFFQGIVEYSDWSVDLKGNSDNLVFSVFKI
jgi:hypothetical protein